MNTQHTHQPRTATPPTRPHRRASLAGLQVTETDMAAWLAAGGERRARPRPVQTPPTR